MKSKILFVVSLLFGLMFINAGLNKFFNYMPVPEDMPQPVIDMSMHMMGIVWLMPLIAVVEIVGGALFIFRKTRALGALVILPVMAGIFLAHLLVAPSGLPMAIVLLIILVWVMIENRRRYLALIAE
ncbi:DoxX-like protein [Anseongella ginsenosidimutans]|uniref:DoxX-like protein n=1 Tax=Anseongella ginsenosidimutans TaxID=496056 RepID=A0A4R3KXN3_9SPHI|nr:DoxX family membrane protein [Anseongella ginsenosidimutans]QEC51109.1 DoxX family membrane protein [Anseongella ginsenosidimutans]TCS90228.1 DoxX-like protein [Anseongella ginsenosidimutans]